MVLYRGYGKDKGAKFMERIDRSCGPGMDELDPANVRLLNFSIQPEEFPLNRSPAWFMTAAITRQF